VTAAYLSVYGSTNIRFALLSRHKGSMIIGLRCARSWHCAVVQAATAVTTKIGLNKPNLAPTIATFRATGAQGLQRAGRSKAIEPMRDALKDVSRFSHYIDFDLAFGKAGRYPKGEDGRYQYLATVVVSVSQLDVGALG
jgi:hypothetical protein